MFEFESPAISKNRWKLCFREPKVLYDMYYENRTPEEGCEFFGLTEYKTMTVYINKNLDGFILAKTLRHELMHIYLWETGQQGRKYVEEDICDITSVASPAINAVVDNILLRLKEGLYKRGE